MATKEEVQRFLNQTIEVEDYSEGPVIDTLNQ